MKGSRVVRGLGTPSLSISGVILAAGYWLVETLIHVYIFREGTFLRQLLPPEPNELWMRSLVCLCFIGFGWYASRVTRQIREFEDEMRTHEAVEESLTEIVGRFVPICAHCKDIRKPDDTWIPLEGYFQERSALKFSHGLCPKCLDHLYPEYAAKAPAPSSPAVVGGNLPGMSGSGR